MDPGQQASHVNCVLGFDVIACILIRQIPIINATYTLPCNTY